MTHRNMLLSLATACLATMATAQTGDARIHIEVITSENGDTRREHIELDGSDGRSLADALLHWDLDADGIGLDMERLLEQAMAMPGRLEHRMITIGGQAYLGVSTSELSKEDRIRLKVPVKQGAFVVNVAKGSPAAAIGLQDEDVITGLGSLAIAGPEDLVAAVRQQQAGDAVKLTWFRGNRKMSAMVTLGERQERSRVQRGTPDDMPEEFRGLLEQLEQQFGLGSGMGQPFLGVSPDEQDETVTGALVGRVEAGSTAAAMGVQPGDLIRSINDEQVDSFAELRERVQSMRPGEPVRLTVLRNGQELELSGTLGSGMGEGRRRTMPPADGSPRIWHFGPDGMMPGTGPDLQQQMDELRREMDELLRDLGRDVPLRDGAPSEGREIDDAMRERLRDKGVKGLDQRLALSDLRLFPNPGSAFFRLEFGVPESGDLQVMVYDAQGTRVYHETITGFKGRYERTLDLGDLPAGTYALVINQGDRSATRELVKM
jgi:hypothetical protein